MSITLVCEAIVGLNTWTLVGRTEVYRQATTTKKKQRKKKKQKYRIGNDNEKRK